jgi:hypothetical protein
MPPSFGAPRVESRSGILKKFRQQTALPEIVPVPAADHPPANARVDFEISALQGAGF